jgi:ABC-type Fe3+-hydroxamate transport system substrate-binding protein
LGRELHLAVPAQRVVSLVPSISEAAVQVLGPHADRLLGCTKFCVHSAELRKRCTVVGGTKRWHADRIEGLAPDLILANKEENEREGVEALARRWPVYVSDVADLADNHRLLRDLGLLLGEEQRAGALIRETDAAFAAWRRKRPRFLRAPRVAYAIWREPWMFAGGGTFIDAMLREAGWNNAFGEDARYPSASLEELRERKLDAVLLSSEPYPFKSEHQAEVAQALPGVPVVFADGEAFSWYGYRPLQAPKAFESVHQALGTA